MAAPKKYSDELRERATRMALDAIAAEGADGRQGDEHGGVTAERPGQFAAPATGMASIRYLQPLGRC